MDIRKLQRAIVDGLEEVKAHNIVVFNTEHLTPLFERVIVASGASNRQTKALANNVRETVKGRGMDVLRTEGEENGEWIIVDCGAAVVHVMQPAIRDYYHLEELWGDKPVRMKIDTAPVKLVKAAPHPVESQSRAAAPRSAGANTELRKPAARKPVGKSPPTRRVPSKASVPARRSPLVVTKKGTAKKTATGKKVARPSAPAKGAAKRLVKR
jgi:ribosome-associated protein